MLKPPSTSGAAPEATSSASAANETPLTYQQLLERGCEYLRREGMGDQQVRNMASALRRWVDLNGFSYQRIVFDEFAGTFDAHFDRFCDFLQQGTTTRTQKDRQEQVLRWKRIAKALRQTDALPEGFSEALALCVRASPLSRAQIARDAGITVRQLEYWCGGRGQPRSDLVNVVPTLERVLELSAGTLLSRLPLAKRSRYQRGVEESDRTTSFTKLRRQQLAACGTYAASFDGRIAEQWGELLALKTDPLREHARARNTWRLKPIDRVAMHIAPWMIVGNQVCPTAAVQWGFIGSYLGWLALPRGQGGAAIGAPATTTLAWLANPELVIGYAKWQMARSAGRFHNGVNVNLQLVESLLRPTTGFLWLRPDLRATVPEMRLLPSTQATPEHHLDSTSAWHAHCASARMKLRAFREKAADTLKVRHSRDPEERIATLLHDEFPLKRLVVFVQSVESSAPPPAHHRDYIAWIRDVVLCRLMISNPLRASQYAAMTFREDGTGNLVKVGAGHYRLKFSASDFKNEKGAACTDYDVAVDPSVAPWIDRYLTEARPHMVDAKETDRFFLTAVRGPRRNGGQFLAELGLQQEKGATAMTLSIRFKALTAIYIPNCPGFGTHACRHIIATDHLRRHPGDYLTVATLLHDKLETVLANYGHLKVQDGLRVLSTGIREATEQLRQERQAPR